MIDDCPGWIRGAERPLWRWWLFCACSWAYARVNWWPLERRILDVMAWSVKPEWLGLERA